MTIFAITMYTITIYTITIYAITLWAITIQVFFSPSSLHKECKAGDGGNL